MRISTPDRHDVGMSASAVRELAGGGTGTIGIVHVWEVADPDDPAGHGVERRE
jgi:hypothetical protein